MDIQTIRKVFSLTDDEYKSMIDFQNKAEHAELFYCSDHDIEWFDFEKGCYACAEERQES
jgi:hypothetical protein